MDPGRLAMAYAYNRKTAEQLASILAHLEAIPVNSDLDVRGGAANPASNLNLRVGPPHTRLMVSIARQMGVDVDRVGDVTTAAGVNLTGPLDGLL